MRMTSVYASISLLRTWSAIEKPRLACSVLSMTSWMSIGSPLARARDDASALPLSSPSAPTACLRAEPKSAPGDVPEAPPDDGSAGVRGDSPPMLIGIQRLLLDLGAPEVN